MIKTAAAGIVMLAAVICYNVEWKGSGDTAQFHLTALQEETAEEGTDALAPAGVENHSPEYAGNTGDSETDNGAGRIFVHRSEEHTSELQSHYSISYAVFQFPGHV